MVWAGSPEAARGPRAPCFSARLGARPGAGLAGAGRRAEAAGELGLGREDSASRRQRAPGAVVRRAGAARAGAERRGEARSASGGGHCHVFPAVAAAAAREEVRRPRAGGLGAAQRRGRRECGRWDSAVPATPAPPPRPADRRGPSAARVPSATRAGCAGRGRGSASPRARRGSGRESPPLRGPGRGREKLGRTGSLRGPGGKCGCRADSGVGGTPCEGVPGGRLGGPDLGRRETRVLCGRGKRAALRVSGRSWGLWVKREGGRPQWGRAWGPGDQRPADCGVERWGMAFAVSSPL